MKHSRELNYEKNKKNVISKSCRECHSFILQTLKDRNCCSILDLGCGNGKMLEQISIENSKAKLFGIDSLPHMLVQAVRKNIPNTCYVVGDPEKIPYDNESFDTVICNQNLYHYKNPQKVFTEAYRVLKKTGIFIICDMNCSNIMFRINNETSLILVNTKDLYTHGANKILSLLRNAGFLNVSWRKINNKNFLSYGIK